MPLSGLILAVVVADILNGETASGLCAAAGAVGLLLAASVAIDHLWSA